MSQLVVNKSSHVLYLYDFDGTLSGDDNWKGFIYNHYACLKTGSYFNPNMFDVRWSILTARPRIDKFFLRTFCIAYGLYPEMIITQPTWFYHSKSKEDDYRYKEQTIKSILDKKKEILYTRFEIKKIIYIDNDKSTVGYLNSKSEGYDYISLSVSDFANGRFS